MTTDTDQLARETRREPDSGPGPERRSRHQHLLVAGAVGLLLTLVAAGHRIARPADGAEPARPVVLASLGGTIDSPSLSPDGRFVAFCWNGEARDNFDVWARPVGEGALVRLTADPAVDASPAFSPDGRQIAFLRYASPDRTLVVVVPAEGGPERVVAQGRLIREGLAWSADGRALVLAEREAIGLPWRLFRVSLGAGEKRVLFDPPSVYGGGDSVPSLSPDGRTLAFTRRVSATSGELWTVAVTSGLEPAGEPRPLTAERWDTGGNAWTPDGRRIVCTVDRSSPGSGSGLAAVEASLPPGPARPIPGSEGGSSPSCARDGKLVFVRSRKDESIWCLPLEGGRPGRAVPLVASPGRNVEPRYSPDGGRIAFSSDRSGSNQVWLCNPDGSGPVQLTHLRAGITSGARFSPDGRRVVFLSDVAGDMEIFLVETDGGDPVRLTHSRSHETAPSWSRDGRWIYFASNREGRFQVFRMRPEPDAPAIRVTRNGGHAALESADGRTLYFSRSESVWSLWKVPVDGGEETLVLPEIPNWGAFDATARALYYVRKNGPRFELRRARFADGVDETLLALEKRYAFGIAAAPDDGALLFSQVDTESTDLMLLEGVR